MTLIPPLLMSLPRSMKKMLMILYDWCVLLLIAVVAWSAAFAFLEQGHTSVDGVAWGHWFKRFLVGGMVAALTLPFLLHFGLYHAIVRYMGEMEVVSLFKAALLSTALFVLFSALFQLPTAWPVGLIYGTLTLLGVGGSRFLVRRYARDFVYAKKSKVIIYGAGALGTQLLKALKVGQDYQPVAVIDDDSRLHGQVMDGIPLCSREQLPHLVYKHGADQLLVAIAALSDGEKEAIFERVKHLPIKVRAIPRMTDLVTGKAKITPVAAKSAAGAQGAGAGGERSEPLQGECSFSRWLADVGRPVREPFGSEAQEALLAKSFVGETLLVVGVGSLTGLAIARWCLQWHRGPLLLVDSAEESIMLAKTRLLHEVGRPSGPASDAVRFLKMNYFDGVSLEQLLRRFAVDRLFYCATDQQVVLNEENVVNVVQNNGLMLRHVLQAVKRAEVVQFMLVSSDKSIRPTSVVGATRRLQEFLVLQAADQETSLTHFGIVRLGNLLEDEHSVLARFRRQILQGGPVTVTHPDARRYFIGVEEAVHLLLQATQMMRNGDIFVLDMGQPVVISDVACRMVQAMGLSVRDVSHPEGDIEIRYTGLKPGEKLFEEPLLADNAEGTLHPRVMRATEWIDSAALDRLVDQLRAACEALDVPKVIELLERSDLGFQSSSELIDPLWLQQQKMQRRRALGRGRLRPVEP